jgi:hypothetical protein
MSRSRSLSAALSVALILGAIASGPVAARPLGTCPAGFELGAMTLEDSIELKNGYGFDTAPPEALAFYTALFASTDKNGNGLACLKDLPDTPGIAPFVFQLADDVSSSGGR